MIEVKNLSKSFKVHKKGSGLMGSIRSLFIRNWIQKEALKGVSFKISAGEIVGLVGANGAGKTTIVKTLAGIIHPTSGIARVLDYIPWERKNQFKKQIALIMGQKAQLWWDLPAADCFLLLREIYQVPKDRFNKNLKLLSEMLEVQDQMNIQIRRLSLGERMKMELIASLLHEPKVVFLDEPTIGLDLTAQRSIRSFLLQYQEQKKPAMIITSHYMEDIERLCNRILILREGELVYDGSIDKIVKDHAPYKIISIVLNENMHDLGSKYGEVISNENGTLKIRVQRNQVTGVSTKLLQEYPVVDLSIEEPEIGLIIESLMKKKKSHYEPQKYL